jgi:hypothetical protein
MKKKYQIPESVSRKGLLRTSLLGSSNPGQTTEEEVKPLPEDPNPVYPDARRRGNGSLMDL